MSGAGLLPGLALAGCVLAGGAGWALLRSQPRLGGLEPPAGDHADAGVPGSAAPGLIRRAADHLGPRAVRLFSTGRQASVRRRLDAAGRPGGLTVEGYAGRQAVVAGATGVTALLLAARGEGLLAVALCTVGAAAVDAWLAAAVRRRQEHLDQDLPDFLDVLAATVTAGVGFRAGLARVAESLDGPLREEVRTLLREIEFGRSRREALEGLRGRNRSQALARFVTALLQAEELGAPPGDALRDFAVDLRRSAGQRARQQAARAAARITVVVALVMVPGAVLLVLATLYVGSGASVGGILG